MKLRSLVLAIASIVAGSQTTFGQGGPTLNDMLNPKAWPNPVADFQSNWLDPYFPTTVLQGQTVWVSSRQLLVKKHKDYYVFFDHQKQNGSAKGGWISSYEHMAYLEWEDPNYPGEKLLYPDPPEVYEAIPFNNYDPRCFMEFNGPYCQIADNPTFLGKVGNYWVAFNGMGRAMGGAFTQHQKDKIKASNSARNGGNLRSDCRADLVNEFLALHPEIAPSEIPVDPFSGNLSTDMNAESFADICHILPAIAPEGNGCGRNAYRNALVVSAKFKGTYSKLGIPSDSFILYCEFLAAKYNKTLPKPLPVQSITTKEVSDVRSLSRMDVEYLDEDETRSLIDYVQKQDATRSGK